jgi:murein DD-endopeptidase MepM/ murein hydrolase activator NlpD
MMAWSRPAPETQAFVPVPAAIQAPPQSREPAALPRLSSRFGYRHHPIRGTRALHSGIDIPGPAGTPVLASAPGTVRFAGRAGGYGNLVAIGHGGGVETRYGHLSRILVRAGETVGTGSAIGLMGSTGLSTGNHLHFEIRDNGHAVDPLPRLARAPRGIARPATIAAVQTASAEPHVSRFARQVAGQVPDPEAGS